MKRASLSTLIAILFFLLAGCNPDTPPTGEADAEPGTPDRQEAEERVEDDL